MASRSSLTGKSKWVARIPPVSEHKPRKMTEAKTQKAASGLPPAWCRKHFTDTLSQAYSLASLQFPAGEKFPNRISDFPSNGTRSRNLGGNDPYTVANSQRARIFGA